MFDLTELRRFVAEGLEAIRSEVVDAEIFAAWNDQLIARLNYTSDIPCNGVQEPKSCASQGVGVLASFQDAGELRVGFGSEAGDLSSESLRSALEKARRNAVHDPISSPFPHPPASSHGWRTITIPR